MNKHSTNNQEPNPTVPILIVSGTDTASSSGLLADQRAAASSFPKLWQEAAKRLDWQAIVVAHSSDCRPYIAAHGGACIVASTWPKVDASMLDATDHAFKRAATILVAKQSQEVELWQTICWDVQFDGIGVETAIDAIKAGIIEASQRRDDWNLLATFHQREEQLSDEESLVMVSICQGFLNKQIASNIKVSIRTIEQRRRYVFEKMGVDSVAPLASLVTKAYEIGRRGRRRNSPGLKQSRFWTNWEEASLDDPLKKPIDSDKFQPPQKGPHFGIANEARKSVDNDQLEN